MRVHGEAAVVAVTLAAAIPFLDQAFHIDEPNFLALARHAAVDPLRLYDFSINWLGINERAFDVLSNPPLVPWYLAAVTTLIGEREWALRLAGWPFVVAALIGIRRLARRFVGPEAAGWTTLWCAVAPAFVLASHVIMPDLALLAAYTLGLSTAIDGLDRRLGRLALAGGVLAGLSGLCRYSGMTALGVLALYVLLHRPPRRLAALAMLGVAIPPATWSLTSYLVYGRVHWLALVGFQTRWLGVDFIVLTTLYQLCAIGLTVVPAVVLAGVLGGVSRASVAVWRWTTFAAGAGVVLALAIALPWPSPLLFAAGFVGGGLVLGLAVEGVVRTGMAWVRDRATRADRDTLFLATWLLGVGGFNLSLRFASVRYVLLALPIAVLLLQRAVVWRPSAPWPRTIAGVAILLLSLGLSKADMELANGYRDYVAALPAPTGTRWFTGHWGLQYYLERAGARTLGPDEWQELRPGDEIIVPTYAWPQPLPPGLLTTPLARSEVPGRPGLRTITFEGRACFYANLVAIGPTGVLLPFGIASGPLEEFSRLQVREPRLAHQTPSR